VDVAHAAGLTETMVYGEIDSFTYIVESMGTGCAFFDYDNDGWMDIFIPGGRRWRIRRPMQQPALQKQSRRHLLPM
jgi:hypothetical protein